MFAHAYREPHPLVEEERAWFAEYHAGFAEAEAEPESESEKATASGGAR
jgi:pyruvate dehydrogenase E1 component alpha subunit